MGWCRFAPARAKKPEDSILAMVVADWKSDFQIRVHGLRGFDLKPKTTLGSGFLGLQKIWGLQERNASPGYLRLQQEIV